MNSSRRAFLLRLAAVAAPITAFRDSDTMTVQQVMELILKSVPGAPLKETVDTLKSGSPNQRVTGIVTTMFATVEVIRKTVKTGANFIIAHEPTFYNHLDATDNFKEDDVYRQKRALLEKHQIAVWRFHDYIHEMVPDGVLTGVLEDLGWKKYYDPANPLLVDIPAQSLAALVDHCRKSLGIAHLKYVGDPTQRCKRIVVIPGAAGGEMQMSNLRKYKPDLLIVGELNEWETSEYVRDARLLGTKEALIVLGHVQSEEPGMRWMQRWLQPQLAGIKVTHIPSTDEFNWK